MHKFIPWRLTPRNTFLAAWFIYLFLNKFVYANVHLLFEHKRERIGLHARECVRARPKRQDGHDIGAKHNTKHKHTEPSRASMGQVKEFTRGEQNKVTTCCDVTLVVPPLQANRRIDISGSSVSDEVWSEELRTRLLYRYRCEYTRAARRCSTIFVNVYHWLSRLFVFSVTRPPDAPDLSSGDFDVRLWAKHETSMVGNASC